MSDTRGDAQSIRRLRHVGTVLFLTIVIFLIADIVLLASIARKERLAAELSGLVAEQTDDLARIGRGAQAILMLRDQGVASETLIEANRAVIVSLSNRAANRDRSIDTLVGTLKGPFFPASEVERIRHAYATVSTAFLTRSIELGAPGASPVSRTWTLPDLAIAPNGVLISSLAHLDRIAREFAATWQRIELGFSIVSIIVVTGLAAVLMFRYFRPLATRALADFLDLEASHSVRTRYFYQMSHELRTPLNVINGYAELLAQSDDGKTTRHAESILKAGRQLAGRVDDILMLAELQSGAYLATPEPLDPAETAHSIAGPMSADGPTVTVLDRREGAGAVETDRVALRTILAHLVRNAASHARAVCEIRLSSGDAGLVIEVVDDGPGIEPAAIARLFQPFHTSTNAVLEADSGPGLGLTIVKLLSDLNRIELTVLANEPTGTTVRLRFPGSRASATDPSRSSPTAPADLSGTATCFP